MSVLRKAKEFNPQLITKSSIMLGLGETDEQIEQTFKGIITYCKCSISVFLLFAT